MAKFKNKIVDMRGRLGANAILDELEQIFALGNRNLDDASTVLQGGLHTFGAEEMVDELCRHLTRTRAPPSPKRAPSSYGSTVLAGTARTPTTTCS